MTGLRFIPGGEVDSLVDPGGLVSAVEEVLRGDAVAPVRASLEHGGAWFAAMPAAGLGYQAVKAVGVYPGNPARGLPLVRGVLLLFREDDGEPLLAADAGPATGWRTAAASALAARLLGYSGGGVLALIGAGVQARYHGLLFKAIYKPNRILVASRTRERAEGLARLLGGEAVEAGEALGEADVVVAATTSTTPVVRAPPLREGAVVLSVGAPRPVVEVDPEVIRGAGCLLVDTREGYLAEAGEAERHPEGVPVVELREALRGEAECRPQAYRVYKSVGTALLDLAVGIHLYERLRSHG